MKRTFLAALLILGCVHPFAADAQRRADRQSLSDERSFSMILLGDPQGYVKYAVNQPILDLCTAWIADNVDHLRIRAVLCTGDLVEQNETVVPDSKVLDQTSREMWEASSRAFRRLDGRTPYIISCGNHDYGYRRAENGQTRFPEYFPIERNPLWRSCCVEAFPNRNGRASIENAAFAFDDPHWGKLLVVALEFHPRDEVLDWARALIAGEKYRHHRVFVITHAYLTNGPQARPIETDRYAISPGNAGAEIWRKLVKPSSNIDLVLCGHTANGNGKFEENVSYRVDASDAGRRVHQMMFNVQTLGGGWEGNGGDGWLRILEFLPDGRTIRVRTYSPLFGISPSTRHLAHRTEPYDRFDMVLDPAPQSAPRPAADKK